MHAFTATFVKDMQLYQIILKEPYYNSNQFNQICKSVGDEINWSNFAGVFFIISLFNVFFINSTQIIILENGC